MKRSRKWNLKNSKKSYQRNKNQKQKVIKKKRDKTLKKIVVKIWGEKEENSLQNYYPFIITDQTEFSPVMINRCTLKEAPSFRYLLGHKLTPDFKWNSYTWSISKNAEKIANSFYSYEKIPHSFCYDLYWK